MSESLSQSSNPLPDFTAPPLYEVALSVQFEPLPQLRTAQIGLLYQAFRQRGFEDIEEHPPLQPVFEQFGPPTNVRPELEIEVLDGPQPIRHWFVSRSGNKLVQVQQDRLVFNWRKGKQSPQYERYSAVKSEFSDNYTAFLDHIAHESLGTVHPTQCEVTYVNHIMADDVWQSTGQADRVLTFLRGGYSDGFLGEPELWRTMRTYQICGTDGHAIGRLHVSAQPAFRLGDGIPMIVLTLAARGYPASPTKEGVMAFFDLGHEWVVRGFASVTTPEMHKKWGRTDA